MRLPFPQRAGQAASEVVGYLPAGMAMRHEAEAQGGPPS